jgi:hypothetical protein
MNSDGTSVFPRVNLDHYVFHINGLPPGFYIKSIHAGPKEALEDTIDLSTGAAPPLRVVVSAKAASIRGVVLDDKQKPAPGTTVVLVPDSIKRREKARFYKEAVADQYGRFQMPNVMPGDYQIIAWERIEFRSWMDPTVFIKYDGAGMKVSLAGAESKTLELKRLPAQ